MANANVEESDPLSVDNLQAQIAQLTRAGEELCQYIAQERASGPPDTQTLQALVQQAQQEIDTLQESIRAAKAAARQHKAAIDQLEQQFNALPAEQRPNAWPKLMGDTMQHHTDIRIREVEIGQLELQKLTVTGRLEEARHSLEALQAGVYACPLAEDPRLVTLQEELTHYHSLLQEKTVSPSP